MANQTSDIGSNLLGANQQAGQLIYNLLEQVGMAIPRVAAQAGGVAGALSTAGDPAMSWGDVGQGVKQAFQQGYSEPFKPMIGPYGEGVKKALKESGYAHATEAIQQGVPPEHIEQQSGLAPQQQAPVQAPGQAPAQAAPQTAQAPQQGSPNPLQLLGQLLGLRQPGSVDANGVVQPGTFLGFQEPASEVLARQQAYSMSPKGSTQESRMKAEQVPLTAEQRVTAGQKQQELQATGFQAQVTSLKDQLARMHDSEVSLQEQMKTYEKTRSPLKKGLTGGSSKEMINTQKQIDKLRKSMSAIHLKLANMYGQQPNFTPSGSGGGLPARETAPKGAKGWDTEKGKWVF